MTPGNFDSSSIHGGNERLLVLVEDGTPLLLGLKIDEVFGVEEAGGVGAVVGAASLADHLAYLREGSHHDARLVGEVDARRGAFAGRQRSAHPDGTFIKMRQKLRADGTAEGEIERNEEKRERNTERDVAMHNRLANRNAIVASEPAHQGVLPLLCALAECEAGHDRRDEDGKDQRADQREASPSRPWA